jgi:hypothetical protein
MSETDCSDITHDHGMPLKMNGRLTAVSGTVKPSASIERSIEEFDCRDLTTKRG